MDTSKTYIEMCDCPEIQSTWKPKQGDWLVAREYLDIPLVAIDGLREGELVVELHWEDWDFLDEDTSIWLPRQDQLQEMVGFTARSIGAIYRWASSEVYDLPDDKENYSFPHDEHWYRNIPLYFNGSWEQLWLAFVMKEKHNKIWNGEEWNEITNRVLDSWNQH